MRKFSLSYLLLLSLFIFNAPKLAFAESSGHLHTAQEHAAEHGHSDAKERHDDEHGHAEGSPVEWTAKLMRQSNIELRTVSSGKVAVGLELPGKIVSYEPNVAHIIPRFPGVIREARKHLGESVNKGDVLAVIESNQSLNPYEVKSPISGVVVKRHSTVGEYASETTDIFVVADLSKVWGEFYVFSDDFGKVKLGAEIAVEAKPLKAAVTSSVSFVSKIVDEHTQSKFIRTILDNSDGLLYPGAFANALVKLDSIEAESVVASSALQRLEGRDVVFVWDSGSFEPRAVIAGRRDKQLVAILSGLKSGESYAAGNTFLLKAEIGKSEAGHDH